MTASTSPFCCTRSQNIGDFRYAISSLGGCTSKLSKYNFSLPFLIQIIKCVSSPEDDSKFKIPHSFNFTFLRTVSLKNTPLNPYSDNFLAASIISRFESGLFGKEHYQLKYLVSHCNSFLITIFKFVCR